MKAKISFRELWIMLLGMLLMSAAIYYLMLPNHLVLGSLSGLVLVLANFIPLSISALTLILNMILLVIGYLFIGKEFGLKTILTSLMLPMYLRLFEIVTPNMESLSGNIVIDLACFMVLIGFGQALLFNMNASSGGIDVIAKLLNKYMGFKIGVSLTIVGFIIAFTSIFAYDREIMVISLLGTYINGIVLDRFCDGFRIRRRVCILSANYREIQDFIVQKLHRGATIYEAYGAYDHTKHIEVTTILEKNEYGKLLAFIHQTDPAAFVTVSTVNEVIGEWNQKHSHLYF